MSNAPAPKPIVFWILWLNFLLGLGFFFVFLKPAPGGAGSGAMWLAGAVPFILSTVVRWRFLPRATSAQAALPLFIIGIALAEASFFVGLFLFPVHHRELAMLGTLGVLQFAPVFAGRFSGTAR